ncbi:MAG TPA: hypothetical protein VNU19_07135 [Candidatus Acidoferrum sp.]|jgi:hypothetical protein|nr:hypothetical protein [Candidatus Acidoferrum sp.]
MEGLSNVVGHVIAELISLGVVVGTLAHALPPIATFLAIVWYATMISDSRRQRRERKATERQAKVAAAVIKEAATAAKEVIETAAAAATVDLKKGPPG